MNNNNQTNETLPEENGQIRQLQSAMMAQLTRLSDTGCNLDLEIKRSNAIASVGNVLVSSIKAELDFMRLTKQGKMPTQLPDNSKKALGNGK